MKKGKISMSTNLKMILVFLIGLFVSMIVVNAGTITIPTNLTNALQVIQRILVTSDGTQSGDKIMDINSWWKIVVYWALVDSGNNLYSVWWGGGWESLWMTWDEGLLTPIDNSWIRLQIWPEASASWINSVSIWMSGVALWVSSIAMGEQNYASWNYSFAAGYQTLAAWDYSFVIGKNNLWDLNPFSEWFWMIPIFEIGNWWFVEPFWINDCTDEDDSECLCDWYYDPLWCFCNWDNSPNWCRYYPSNAMTVYQDWTTEVGAALVLKDQGMNPMWVVDMTWSIIFSWGSFWGYLWEGVGWMEFQMTWGMMWP